MELKEINKSRLLQFKFYEDNKFLAYETVKKYIKNDFDVDEVVQIGFMKIFKHLDNIEVNKNFKGLMYTVFKNSALDFLRKKRYDYEFDDNTLSDIIEESQYCQQMLLDIEKEMNTLSPMYHIVFKCYHLDNMTHKDISKKLGISEGTSKSNLHKATKNIQKKLKNKIYE